MDFFFNMNNHVKVKLTDKGLAILKANHDKMNKIIKEGYDKELEEFKPHIDENGYYTTTMWDLIEVFGGEVSAGFDNPLKANIICCNGTPIPEDLL